MRCSPGIFSTRHRQPKSVPRTTSSFRTSLASATHPKRSISAPAAHAVPLGDIPGASSVAWLRDTWHEHANRSLALATKLTGFQGCPSPVGTPGSLTNGAACSFSSSSLSSSLPSFSTSISFTSTAGYLCGKKRLASSREIWVVLLSFLSLLLLADMLRKNHVLLLQSATVGIEFLFVLSRESVYARGLRVISTWERESGVRFANVAVVNLEEAEMARFNVTRRLIPLAVPHAPGHLDWNHLYPEWINETIPNSCPYLPEARWQSGRKQADALLARVECREPVSGWAKDVEWQHMLLSLANLVVQADKPWMPLVLISDCRPPLNLLPCDRLVKRDGPVWLYNLTASDLRTRLQPAGSCGMAQPTLTAEAASPPPLHPFSHHPSCFLPPEPPAIGTVAYATVLHTVENYVCGAIVLGHSIRRSGSQHDMVALVSREISNRSRDALREAGWIVKEIDRIRNPYGSKTSYNQWNYSKLLLWQLTEYTRVVFVDADLLVLRNLDHLFAFPDVAARGNDQTDFNSGLMLLRPSHCTFRELLANVHTIRSPNGGDQGYLNNIFTWWHRLPNSYNTLKHIWASDPKERALELEMKNRWFSEEPAEIHTIHYLGRKPWQCYRDFDCTWLYPWDHNFANEAAHKRWWAMHDSMPEPLQQMCWLRNEDKTEMEFRKRGLEAKNAPPAFWNFTVTDPRKDYCFPGQKTCQWELYLEHWKRR
ncbi:unnamed protein product [Closterium sp. Yama58-4]|nr:unnamed protein product [Closterium sp. Yama58-4]